MRARLMFFAIVFAIFASQGATAQPRIQCEGNEENLARYQEIHQVLFIERDTTRVGEFYADPIISHNIDAGEAGARQVRNEDMKAMWDRSRTKDPARMLSDELILCVDDFVIVRTIVSGVEGGSFLGLPPTNKPYEYTATDIYRFEDGKVAERWGNADVLSKIRQLGFTITPATEDTGDQPENTE